MQQPQHQLQLQPPVPREVVAPLAATKGLLNAIASAATTTTTTTTTTDSPTTIPPLPSGNNNNNMDHRHRFGDNDDENNSSSSSTRTMSDDDDAQSSSMNSLLSPSSSPVQTQKRTANVPENLLRKLKPRDPFKIYDVWEVLNQCGIGARKRKDAVSAVLAPPALALQQKIQGGDCRSSCYPLPKQLFHWFPHHTPAFAAVNHALEEEEDNNHDEDKHHNHHFLLHVNEDHMEEDPCAQDEKDRDLKMGDGVIVTRSNAENNPQNGIPAVAPSEAQAEDEKDKDPIGDIAAAASESRADEDEKDKHPLGDIAAAAASKQQADEDEKDMHSIGEITAPASEPQVNEDEKKKDLQAGITAPASEAQPDENKKDMDLQTGIADPASEVQAPASEAQADEDEKGRQEVLIAVAFEVQTEEEEKKKYPQEVTTAAAPEAQSEREEEEDKDKEANPTMDTSIVSQPEQLGKEKKELSLVQQGKNTYITAGEILAAVAWVQTITEEQEKLLLENQVTTSSAGGVEQEIQQHLLEPSNYDANVVEDKQEEEKDLREQESVMCRHDPVDTMAESGPWYTMHLSAGKLARNIVLALALPYLIVSASLEMTLQQQHPQEQQQQQQQQSNINNASVAARGFMIEEQHCSKTATCLPHQVLHLSSLSSKAPLMDNTRRRLRDVEECDRNDILMEILGHDYGEEEELLKDYLYCEEN